MKIRSFTKLYKHWTNTIAYQRGKTITDLLHQIRESHKLFVLLQDENTELRKEMVEIIKHKNRLVKFLNKKKGAI